MIDQWLEAWESAQTGRFEDLEADLGMLSEEQWNTMVKVAEDACPGRGSQLRVPNAAEPHRVIWRLFQLSHAGLACVRSAEDSRLPPYVTCERQSLPRMSVARLSVIRAADSWTESRARCAYREVVSI